MELKTLPLRMISAAAEYRSKDEALRFRIIVELRFRIIVEQCLESPRQALLDVFGCVSEDEKGLLTVPSCPCGGTPVCLPGLFSSDGVVCPDCSRGAVNVIGTFSSPFLSLLGPEVAEGLGLGPGHVQVAPEWMAEEVQRQNRGWLRIYPTQT